MANSRAHEEAWTTAKKICRLTARQVEMARALGMNPKMLPRLRPSPQQRWKLPVGEFIEEGYRKHFGGASATGTGGEQNRDRATPSTVTPTSRTVRHGVVAMGLNSRAPELVQDPACQLSDLACYLVNLADDLERWLVHGSIDPGVLPQVRQELQEIAKALDTGAPISPIPAIPLPPKPTRRDLSRRGERERPFEDDEIPF